MSGASGSRGASGAVLAGYAARRPADGLITSRDGIVGSWLSNHVGGAQLNTEDVVQLERWEPLVRAEVFDYELASLG
jgi:hypothetical protein